MTEPSERPAIQNLRGQFTSPDLQQRLKALSDCLKFEQGLDLLAQQALTNPSEQIKQSAYWVLYGDNPYLTENVNLRSPNIIQDTISCVAISSEYKIIVGGGWKTIRIWNLETGKLIDTINAHSHWVLSVAISSNGQYLVSSSIDKTVKLWSLKTKINLHTFTGHTSWVNVVKITPDNQTLISGSADKTIKVWNLGKKELVHTFKGHTGWISCLAISSDSKFLVSGSTDKTIKLWGLTKKQLLRTLEGHSDWIQNVAISSDNQSLVTGSRDGTLKIWQKDPKTPTKTPNNIKILGYIIIIISAILAELTVGKSLNLPFLTLSLNIPVLILLTRAFFFRKDNNQSNLKLPVKDLKCIKTTSGKFQIMTDFDITSNGNIKVIGTHNGSIYIQNTNQPRKITGHAGFISSIAVSSNNQRFVSGSRDWIKLWDLQKGEILEVLEGEFPKLRSLKINPSKTTLYCGQFHQFKVEGFDQYNQPIKIDQINWTATGGTINNGFFTAGNISNSNFTVHAKVNTVSCQASVTILEKPKLTSLKINPPAKNLYCGDYQEFTIQGFDQYNKPIEIENITWTATGGEVEDGLFQAGNISGYNFKIQAKVNTISCQSSVTIRERPKLKWLTINPSITTLYCCDTQQFSAEGFDQYNQPISIGQITWTADNIELPNNGKFVAGHFEKTVTITAKVETISQSIQVKVIEFPRLTSLSISPSLIEMCPGQRYEEFTLQGLDQRGNPISIKNVNWTATGGTIDDKGNYTVGDNSKGQFTVTASIPGQTISATAKIIVPSILTHLMISPQTISAEPNEPITFQVMGLDQIGDWFWVNDIEWKCTAGGQIDREGVFKGGYEKYQVTVTAKVSLLQVSATVNILPVLRQIQINPHQDISFKPKEIIIFNVVGFDQYGNEIETGNIVWEATGGIIDQKGKFTAKDNDKGFYKVTAKVSPLSPYDMRSKLLALGIYTKLISRSIYWTERLSSLSDKIRSVLFPNSAKTEIQDQSETSNNISTASEQNSSSELSNFEIDLQAWVIKQAIKITVRLLDWVGDSCINLAKITDSVNIQVVPVPKIKDVNVSSDFRDINLDQPSFISEVIEKVSDTIEDVRDKLDNSKNNSNPELTPRPTQTPELKENPKSHSNMAIGVFTPWHIRSYIFRDSYEFRLLYGHLYDYYEMTSGKRVKSRCRTQAHYTEDSIKIHVNNNLNQSFQDDSEPDDLIDLEIEDANDLKLQKPTNSRTTDLVLLYLQEIGRVRLLRRDEEVSEAQKVQRYLRLVELRDNAAEQDEELINTYVRLIKTRDQLSAQLGHRPSLERWATKAGVDVTELKPMLAAGKRCWAEIAGLTVKELDRIQTEGIQSKDRMIKANLRLVVWVAKEYRNRGLELLDLIQEGTLGLERAVEKFNPTPGYRFSTYSYWWIRQAITRAIAQTSRTIRIPVHITEKLNKIKKAQRKIFREKGRTATIDDIAHELEMTPVQVREVLLRVPRSVSLETKVGTDKDTELGDLLETDEVTPEEMLMRESLHRDLQNLLADLSSRERDVILMRYGLGDGHSYSLGEIGRALELSRERVRQIEAKALQKLRQPKCRNRVRDYLEFLS